MRVEVWLLALTVSMQAYAADEPAPLSLEFLEFLELLGDGGVQDEMVELLMAAEGMPEGAPEAGADDNE